MRRASARRGRPSPTSTPTSTRSATSSPSAPPAPISGRPPTTTARSSCRAACGRELRRHRQGRLVRRHAHQRQGGHHGPQRVPQGGGNATGYLVFAEKGDGEAEFMHDAGGNGQVNNTDEPVANGCGTSIAADVAEGREVRHEVLRLLLAQRHGVDAGRPTTTILAAATQDIGLFVDLAHRGDQGHGQVHRTGRWTPTRSSRRSRRRPRRVPADGHRRVRRPLNTTRWTVRARPPAQRSAAARCTLAVTNGDIDGTNTGPISYVGQTAARPATGWRRRKVTLDQDNDWQYGALAVHVDDNNYTKLAFTENTTGGRFVEFWSRPTVRARATAATPTCRPTSRPRSTCGSTNNGGTLTGAWSQDGTTGRTWAAPRR